MNIFVTNFSRSVGDEGLEARFGRFGEVEEVEIWVYYAERSIRFAIVKMPHSHEAKRAIKHLDGRKNSKGKRLWVERAPKAFGSLGEICADAASNNPIHWRPVRYRPHRVDRN
jgi:hypothetical protein